MTIELRHHTNVTIRNGRVAGRRDFLRAVSGVGLAAGVLGWHDLVSLKAEELRRQGRACILLWMGGGPSQFETFSPKPGHENGGPTKAIKTAAPGVEIAEGFPLLAQEMRDVAIIRSITSKEGAHPRATSFLHTGYLPTASVKHPAFGAVVAQELRRAELELPAFVRVGQNRQNTSGGGLLGSEFDPFIVQNPNRPPVNTRPATSLARFDRRIDLLGKMEADYAKDGAEREVQDHQKLYRQAQRMIESSAMKAFDLSGEPESMREAYGNGEFGAGCLLARRLVEAGIPFVEVTLGGWDTHADNFDATKKLAGQMDRPFAQLIADLRSRGLLETTLVVWMGEFGRTPRINPRAGRDHYPAAFNVALAGGGVRGGQVIGETNQAGNEITNRPVKVVDLFQSFAKSLAIDPAKENMSSIGRPIKLVDGGQPVAELFS